MFLTVTCPSKYHATTENVIRIPNGTGHHARLHDYLLTRFCAVRKKLNRDGLRCMHPHGSLTMTHRALAYDGLCSSEEIDTIVSHTPRYCHSEDRHELDDITPRFKASTSTAQKAHRPATSPPTLEKPGQPCLDASTRKRQATR
ncbi:replication endonuclease [Escherichia coli]|uniref:replication endonuclease n=1 Tax=Escherichia coli TaxID=562 RepID=UPI003D9A4E85